jgi:hypothetical protein
VCPPNEKTPSIAHLASPQYAQLSNLEQVSSQLLPVLAQNLSDIRLKLTSDGIELSGSFRPIDQLVHPTPAESGHYQGRHLRAISLSAGPVDSGTNGAADEVTSAGGVRRLGRTVTRSIIAVSLVGLLSTAAVYSSKRTQDVAAVLPSGAAVLPTAALTAWSSKVDARNVQDWIDLQTSLKFSDAALTGSIELVRDHPKYPVAHRLNDLTLYPKQVHRALSLTANKIGDINSLIDDLKQRLLLSANFPDEQARSNLPGLAERAKSDYDNLVVIATLELLLSTKDDPRTKAIFASLTPSK